MPFINLDPRKICRSAGSSVQFNAAKNPRCTNFKRIDNKNAQ